MTLPAIISVMVLAAAIEGLWYWLARRRRREEMDARHSAQLTPAEFRDLDEFLREQAAKEQG